MEQQKYTIQQNQSLEIVKQPDFNAQSLTYQNYQQPQNIEEQNLLQNQIQTMPQQQSNQPQEYQPLDSYIISKTLGKGNFGKVKLAVHKLTQQYVAVKILQKDLIFENTDVVRITRQLKIMKKLRHPFVVQLYEIIETAKQLYLIMEYAQGGDLFQKIVNEERIKQTEAAKIYAQIVLGMDYFHSKGITHRDLKPQNILMSKDGTIKIADFGLGNMFKPQEKLKTACGSPCYASPQMLNRQPYDPKKIDIWSSGIIMYAMVCGYLPFQDQVTAKLYEKIKNSNVKLPSWVSSPCRNLIRGLLTKDPKIRYDVESILSHEMILPHVQTLRQIVRQKQLSEDKIEEICEMYDIEEREKLVSDLNKNRHNNLTTLYYLGVKRLGKLQKQKKFQENIKNQQQNESKKNEQEREQLDEMQQEHEDSDNKKAQTQINKVIKVQQLQLKIPVLDKVMQLQNEVDGNKEQEIEVKYQKKQIQIQAKSVFQSENHESQKKKQGQQKQEQIKPQYQNQSKQNQANQIQQEKTYQEKSKQNLQGGREQKQAQIMSQEDEKEDMMLSDEQLQAHRIYQQQNQTQSPSREFTENKQEQNQKQDKQYEIQQQDTKKPVVKTLEEQQKENMVQQKQHLMQASTQHKQAYQYNEEKEGKESRIKQSYQLSMQIEQNLKRLNELQSSESQSQHIQMQSQSIGGQSNHLGEQSQQIDIHSQNPKINQFQLINSKDSHQQQNQQQKQKTIEIFRHQKQTNQGKQTQSIDSIQNDNKQQVLSLDHVKDQGKNQQLNLMIKNQKLTEVHIQANQNQQTYDPREQAELIQQIETIQHSITKIPIIQSSSIQLAQITKDQTSQKTNDNNQSIKPFNKLTRQQKKVNHLISTDKVIPQKSTDQKLPSQNMQKNQFQKQTVSNSKIEVKNILAARNIILNERSHSKDTPIIFKSNKNKPNLKSQQEKDQKSQKDKSKQKKTQQINKLSEKKSQLKQKTSINNNQLKTNKREKFTIAKDSKQQKTKGMAMKNQSRIIETPKSSRSIKNQSKPQQQSKKNKDYEITSIKEQKEINQNKNNRIKSNILIYQSSKKFSGYAKNYKNNFNDQSKQQNVPISPISGVKSKDNSQTFNSIKLGLQNQEKKSNKQLNEIQEEKKQYIFVKEEGKKVLISKNKTFFENVKTKSFSQYSNPNSTITQNSYSKIQISKTNQYSHFNKGYNPNKTLGSFTYNPNASSAQKQKIVMSGKKLKTVPNINQNELFKNGSYRQGENVHKQSSQFQFQNVKYPKQSDQNNFKIRFYHSEPVIINPELILFVSVEELYTLIERITESKNANSFNIIGSLIVYVYPTKDYMYVLNSQLFKSYQIPFSPNNSQTRSNTQVDQNRKKTKIGTLEFVQIINSILMTN